MTNFENETQIWQNLCTFKNLYFSKFDCKKIMAYWGNYKYNI